MRQAVGLTILYACGVLRQFLQVEDPARQGCVGQPTIDRY